VSIPLAIMLQLAVSVQAPDTIAARSPVTLTVRATAPGNAAPKLSALSAPGATLQLIADVTRLGGGFGQAVATREIRYSLSASAPGIVVLSPVVATLGVQQSISPATRIVVRPAPTNAIPSLVMRAPVSRANEVNFHALARPDTVWAGEQVTLQVGVFIDDELRSRLQRNPEYVPPAVDGAAGYDLPVANDALPTRDVDGVRYRPFIFARALFPLRAGTLTIPAAKLAYTLSVPRTVFGRVERQTVLTPVQRVFVRELPADSRPVNFSGAVGIFTMDAFLDSKRVRVGDALQLTVNVTGAGNIKLLPAPRISVPGMRVSPAGEDVTVDSTDLLIRGTKSFRFLLTPAARGAADIGTLRYSFFNPVRGAYDSVSVALGAVTVTGEASIEADDDGVAPEALPLMTWRPTVTDDVTERWWFRALFLGLALPWLVLAVRRVLRGSASRAGSTRRGKSDATMLTVTSVADVRRVYLRSLAPIAGVGPDAAVATADLARLLRRAGVTAEAADAATALLERLDREAFAGAEPRIERSATTLLAEVQSVLAQLEKERAAPPVSRLRTARAVGLLVCCGLAPVRSHAQSPEFQRGVRAYQSQQFTVAAEEFAHAAATAPSDAAAWANLGMAQWMRADTAGAIVAWQRSARLAPRDGPSLRLINTFAPAQDLSTTIPPVTPNTSWLLLLVVTCVLSLSGAAWRWSHRTISAAALFGATGVVAICAGLAFFAQRAAVADGLLVIRQDAALRAEPVLAGEAAARVRAGEIATLLDARGTWRLVSAPGGRTGWVETDAVRSLAARDARDVALAERRVAMGGPEP
jgi:Bacterial SH3 domain